MQETNIYNLTTRETELIATVWGMSSLVDYEVYKLTLSPIEQLSLDYLVVVAAQGGDDIEDLTLAKKVLAKFRL